jgi:endonuclease/exonuclease/phosphatase family metal-dependent hydrolase
MAKHRISFFFLFLLILIPTAIPANPYDIDLEKQPLTVITYNVQTEPTQTAEEQTAKFMHSNTQGLKELFNTHPDVVNLQEVPLGGIQWLEKNYGQNYSIVYAPKHKPKSTEKLNDYSVILYKKSRFEILKRPNSNPMVKTKYLGKHGEFMLLVDLKDLNTQKEIIFVNSHVRGGLRKQGNTQVKEMIQHIQQYPYVVIAGDINAKADEKRMESLKAAGFIGDPVAEATEPERGRKMDHVLYKANGRSKFIEDQCAVKSNIKGSDHFPLSCRILLQ